MRKRGAKASRQQVDRASFQASSECLKQVIKFVARSLSFLVGDIGLVFSDMIFPCVIFLPIE
jgi:hypothetical protein